MKVIVTGDKESITRIMMENRLRVSRGQVSFEVDDEKVERINVDDTKEANVDDTKKIVSPARRGRKKQE